MSEQEFLTEAGVARHYGVAPATVNAWRKAGLIAPDITAQGLNTTRLYLKSQLPPRGKIDTKWVRSKSGLLTDAINLVKMIDQQAPHLSQEPAVCVMRRSIASHRERLKKARNAFEARKQGGAS